KIRLLFVVVEGLIVVELVELLRIVVGHLLLVELVVIEVVVELLVIFVFVVLFVVGWAALDKLVPRVRPELHVRAPPGGLLGGIITNIFGVKTESGERRARRPWGKIRSGRLRTCRPGGVAQRQSRGLISPVSEVRFLPPPPHLTRRVFLRTLPTVWDPDVVRRPLVRQSHRPGSLFRVCCRDA